MISPLFDTVTPDKREFVLSGSDGKGKIIKINEFNDNTLIPLEPTDTRRILNVYLIVYSVILLAIQKFYLILPSTTLQLR